jgi:hypothetical protein
MANDPRKNLAATCQKKQSFLAGKFGMLDGILPTDGVLGGVVGGVEKGLGAVVDLSAGTAGELNGLLNGGVDGISDLVLGPGGANVGGSGAVRGILGTISGKHADSVNAASANILELAGIDELSHSNVLNELGPFADAAELLGNITGNGETGEESTKCSASPYAADLISLGIKMKHLFVVEFEFAEPYATKLGRLHTASVIKQCDRPTVTFDYEDVNLYNYRTKVATKTTHNNINMTFYDDERGNALGFYDLYHRAMSPMANISSPYDMEGNFQPMEFDSRETVRGPLYANSDPLPFSVNKNASSIGPLNDSWEQQTNHIITRIRIYHVYKAGGIMDVYTLMNPKVTEMQLDELTMEESGVNQLTLQLSYDSFFLETGFSPAPDSKGSGYDGVKTYNLEYQSGSRNAFTYPLVHNGPSILQKSQEELTQEQIDAETPKGLGSLMKSAISGATGSVSGLLDSLPSANGIDITDTLRTTNSGGATVTESAGSAQQTASIASGFSFGG